MKSARVPAFLLLAPLLGCSARPTDTYIPTDGGSSPVDRPQPVTCSPGMVLCNGNQSYECDSDHTVINQRACSGATALCFPGLGCRTCRPGSARCNPANGQQIQTCRSDGMGYDDGPTCNSGNGQTCTGGVCADRCSDSALGRSYLGCDYWPTVTVNSQLDPLFEFAVVLSNPQTYAVTTTISGGALASPRTITLAPNAVQTVTLPWVQELIQYNPANRGCMGTEIMGCGGAPPGRSALRTNGAYHVHSNGPIAAYQFNPLNFERAGNYRSFTNDASLLLPQGVLTQRYTVSTFSNWRPLSRTGVPSAQTFGGFVSIVGVAGESTTVTVRLSATISSGTGVMAAPAGSTQTYRLQPGDVVQLVGTGDGDLTGTTIDATLPVAVFVGHDCSNVPLNRAACDHLEEQLLPNETWGREYVVSALRDRGPMTPSVLRVVSQADNNQITFEPSVRPPATLRAGQLLEFATTDSFRVTGTGAFLVSQFMIGQGDRTAAGPGAGDPAMVFEVPVQQYRTGYDFFVPSTYTSNFINIMGPAGVSLTMDGQPVRGSMQSVGPYTVYYLPIPPGAHHIQSAGDQPFGIKVYGIAEYTSYMYPGGLDLRVITPG